MTKFIQLHILTSYPASNLNRDDTGRPKSLVYGGAERIRISSQSLKRAFRESTVFAAALPGAIGKRSQDFAAVLVKNLEAKGLSNEEAIKRVASVIENDKLGKIKKDSSKTEQLVHLGQDELALLNELSEQLAEVEKIETKNMLVLKNKPKAADIAMFGRMLADNSGFNVEASVQVAHAFTTHRVTIEDDFYTAVDDIKTADTSQDRGAGFLGVQQYGAGLFYLYICINADLLLSNLDGDKALAKNAIAAFIEAAATTSPTGKQNAFASRSRAQYILQEIGADMPRTLGVAFQNPIGGSRENDYLNASITRMDKLRNGYKNAYGDNNEALVMDTSSSETKSLKDLIDAAIAVFDGL